MDLVKNVVKSIRPIKRGSKNNLFIFIGYVVVFLHLVFKSVIIFIPYMTNNIYILLFVIVTNVFLLTQWLLFGSCSINKFENQLLQTDDTTYENGNDKSIFVRLGQPFFGEKLTFILLSFIPLVNSTYSGVKIAYILQNHNIPFQ
jgi:hypothetical protein